MVAIGNLSERITLQAETRTPDAAGGASLSWTTLGTVFAQVTPLSARERFASGQMEHVAIYRFTIRTPQGFAASAAARLQWLGLNYNITGVQLNGNPFYTDIIAAEGGAV